MYEITENKKVIQLNDHVFAMFAGDIVAANEIVKMAISDISATDSVIECVTKVQDAYYNKLALEIDNQILRKHGLDLSTFQSQQRSLDPTFVQTTIQNISISNLAVEIIIAGKTDSSPEIHLLDINGTHTDQTPIGYAQVGSGSNHASLSMIESEMHPSKERSMALYALIKAKKKAEYDPNVGHMSTMVIFKDSIEFIEDAVIDELWSEYDKTSGRINKSVQQSSTRMEGIVYGNS